MNKVKVKQAFLFFLSLQLLFSINLLAQETLSLEEAIDIASRNNVTLKIAYNNYKIAENNFHIGNAGFLPRFDLSLSTTYNDNYSYIFGNKNYISYTMNLLGFKASYVLFDGMRNYASYSKLKYVSKLSYYKSKSVAEQIILQVIQQYNRISLLQEQVEIAKESMEISRERLFRQKEKEKLGQSGNIDYLSSVVDFNKDSLNYIYAITQLEQVKQNFNGLLNRDIDLKFTADGKITYEKIPDKAKLLELALKNNSDFNSAKEEINISKEEKRMAKSAFFPKLNFESAYGYNTMPNEFSLDFSKPNKTFYAGVTLQYNIFNGFQNDIYKQNAEIQLQNSKLSERDIALKLRAEISNAYIAYVNSKTALKLEKTSLQTTELNFKRMKEMYELGKVTLTQFREAQLKLIGAKNRISEFKYSIKNNEAVLLKLAGILLSED